MNDFRLYFRYIGLSLRSQMEYRVSFVLQTLAHFLTTGLEFVAVWALFERFDNIRGWTFYEVAVFYGLISMAFAINEFLMRGFDILDRLIRSGEFDRYLLRPRSTILQLLGYEVTLRRFGRFSQGALVLWLGASHLHVDWTLTKVAMMLWIVVGASALFMGLILMQATLAFWTTESLEIVNVLTYGGIETARFPMTIYQPWFRKFFTVIVPLACVNYYPVLLIVGKPDPLGSPLWFQAVAPVAGLLFLLAGRMFWSIGVRHYASTGS